MESRRLGTSDIYVSALAFGTWAIGGRTPGNTSYGVTDDQESLRALRSALDLGVNLYDTSNVYGAGHSEVLLGRAFANCRDKVIFATKAGWASYEGPPDFSPRGLRESVEGSLRRLRTDYIDVLQLHNPPSQCFERHTEVIEALQELVAAGKIRVFGVSVRTPDEAALFTTFDNIATVQLNLNMMDARALQTSLLTRLKKHGQSVLVRTPLCFGFLSDRIDHSTVFSEGDHRGAWSEAQRRKWIEGSRILNDLVAKHGEGPLHEAALRYCVSHSGVASVVCGMLSPSEVSQNTKAIQKGPLPTKLLEEIATLNAKETFFVKAVTLETRNLTTLKK